jgi:tetraprenyl-beta-curcumene synthase
VPVFGDGSLTARAGVALLLANGRYWPTVAPTVRQQLRHWEQRAQAIPDPQLRRVALEKLHGESFNAEGTTTLATLARRPDRPQIARAIVAMQVMYDYLDGLAEQPAFDNRDDRQLFRAFTDAVTPTTPVHDYYLGRPHSDDAGYLNDLTTTVRDTFVALPASDIATPVAQRAAARCAEAQIRVHARGDTGASELEAWAIHEAVKTTLGWRAFLAGAVTSAMSVYALIAAGTDPQTTREQASAIDVAYLSIGALATMLDSLIDYKHDVSNKTQWYFPYYQDPALLAEQLSKTAREALTQARRLPHAAHHVMTLAGVAAYYLSTPEAKAEPARTLTRDLHQELRPLITPTLTVMRAWRAATQARHVRSREHTPQSQ